MNLRLATMAWVDEQIFKRLRDAGIFGRTIDGSYVRGVLPGNVVTYGAPTGQIDIGDTNTQGVAEAATRTDHQHNFPAPGAGYPVDVDATEADGVATTPARADHRHALGIMTTLGDILYRSASAAARLTGNTTATKKFLTQTGTGAASAAPAWDTIADADVPAIHSGSAHHAQTHGASDHTDRTRSILIPPRVFGATQGSPVLVTFGASPALSEAWAFDATTRESIGTSFELPADWAAGTPITVYVRWAADTDTNTSHACRWSMGVASINDGDSIDKANDFAGGTLANVPSTTARIRATANVYNGSTNLGAGKTIRMRIARFADQGDDDMTGDALLLGVLIEYTADA